MVYNLEIKYLTKTKKVYKTHYYKLFFKSLVYEYNLPVNLRLVWYNKLQQIKIYENCLNKYCLISFNKSSVYTFFKLSRHNIRSLGYKGLLNGVFKSSW